MVLILVWSCLPFGDSDKVDFLAPVMSVFFSDVMLTNKMMIIIKEKLEKTKLQGEITQGMALQRAGNQTRSEN